MTPGDTLTNPTPPLPTPRTPLFRRGSREVEPLSRGGFADAFHGPPPGGGASRRWEDFRLSVTARPRMGGRRAVLRWRRVVILVVIDPLWGAGPAYPAEGEGGDEVGFSMTGRPLPGWVRLGGARSARPLPLRRR